MWRMFLDDLREPEYIKTFNWGHLYEPKDFVVARSYDTAVRLCEAQGCPSFITFDHDLGLESDGSEKTGYDLAKWLVDKDMDSIEQGKGYFIPDEFDFEVHSSNPVGQQNIIMYLINYLRQRA